jgi:hypothetical protein
MDDEDIPKLVNVINVNSNTVEIDGEIDYSDVFVFGKEIIDFHALKKEDIFTLNVYATQELYKLVQQQNIIFQDLQQRIEILENKQYIHILYNAPLRWFWRARAAANLLGKMVKSHFVLNNIPNDLERQLGDWTPNRPKPLQL